MWNLRPTIARGETEFEFPRPILVCRVHDSWDFLKVKVPLRAGDQVSGASRDGVDLTLEGQIGSQSGSLKLTEGDMLEALLQLRDALQPDDSSGYSLALFYENEAGTYRFFRQCTTDRFDFDLSHQSLYSYSATIHCADPELYSGLLP